MTISSKPKSKNADVEALINKGGSVAAAEPELLNPDAKFQMQLRLPADALARIEAVIKKRNVKPPRHTWILEAIYEKLEREERP